MGFFSNIVSATIKTALTPVAIVKDVVEVATGGEMQIIRKIYLKMLREMLLMHLKI
jgi:hypothetical protein